MTAGDETDSPRWIITAALVLLAVIAVLGMLVALAWLSAVAGDSWGAWTYASIAVLVAVLAMRNL